MEIIVFHHWDQFNVMKQIGRFIGQENHRYLILTSNY